MEWHESEPGVWHGLDPRNVRLIYHCGCEATLAAGMPPMHCPTHEPVPAWWPIMRPGIPD